MEQNTEEITICLTDCENIMPRKERRQAFSRLAIIAISLLLILISVCAHFGIAAAFIEYSKEQSRLQNDLIKAILPSFEVQEAFSEEEKIEIHKKPSATETIPEVIPPPAEETFQKNSVSRDLSTKNDHGFALKNETTYNPDLDVLWNSQPKIEKTDKLSEKYTEDEPLVLIYHTHATESYNNTNDTGTYRSNDPEKNMISIGATVSESLETMGIKTLHITDMFDESSYNTSYSKSAVAVEKELKKHPSIRYIIDIHRDSVTDESGNSVSADFIYNGETAAQMMFVVGTDEGGSGHTEWRDNLTTVLHLQDRLCRNAPSSMRPINLRKASFYQDKGPGAMLVEIGTVGNTLEEAKRSAAIFANALADYMTGKGV